MRLFSTTDDQSELDNAAAGRISREREPSWIYTEVGPSIQSADGTTEHSPVIRTTNLRAPKPNPENFRLIVDRITPEIERNWEVKKDAARSCIPEFTEVTQAERDLQLPVSAALMLKGGVHNGIAVCAYLARHPVEAERLRNLDETNPRGVQARIRELSAEITVNEAAGLDKASYRDFARIRNKQARERFRG